MRIDDMISELKTIKTVHGNIPIVGGYMSDDIPPRRVIILNKNDGEWSPGDGKATGVFIE